VSVSRRRGFEEWALRWVGVSIYRCRSCYFRYRQPLIEPDGVLFAHCPKCLSQDLSQRNERFAHLERLTRWMLMLRAKPCFCNTCRWNFASFRPIQTVAAEDLVESPSRG
jgi:predicted Zn-ribbon and HTH transcriptional regulator